jgi:transcriptional regulator with XRE-family HTH domain
MRRTTTAENAEKREKDIRRRLARNVGRIRAERGFSREQLEERSGISLRDIERLEASDGNIKVTLTTVVLLANALSVDPVELVARVKLAPKKE